jgi:hypothetical protein
MRIYRLQHQSGKHAGPFAQEFPDPFSFMTGQASMDPSPALQAQTVAAVTGVTLPFSLPGPFKDGLTESQINEYINRIGYPMDHAGPIFGFASMDQYHEWFTTPLVRKALFTKVDSMNRKHPVDNDMELRCFEIPDDRVLMAGHQVLFYADDAVNSVQIPRKEAID